MVNNGFQFQSWCLQPNGIDWEGLNTDTGSWAPVYPLEILESITYCQVVQY